VNKLNDMLGEVLAMILSICAIAILVAGTYCLIRAML
jgi:hypothetical protein